MTTSSPRLTVITPNLNQGPYLEQTLCSVLDQGYENLEFFVTDGGSTDHSIEVVRLYEDGLSCWRSGPDAGPGSAVNWALSRARGELVLILPSHDLLMPGALQEAVDYFSASDTSDWLVGQASAIGPADEPLGPIMGRPIEPSHAPDQNQDGSVIARAEVGVSALAACCFRRHLFDSLGPMSESNREDFGTDWVQRLVDHGHYPARLGATFAAVRKHAPHRPGDSAAQPSIQINQQVCRDLAYMTGRLAA